MKTTNEKAIERALEKLDTEANALAARMEEILTRLNDETIDEQERERGERANATNIGARMANGSAAKALRDTGTLEAVQGVILHLLFTGDHERTINNIGFRNAARAALTFAAPLSHATRAKNDEADQAPWSCTTCGTKTTGTDDRCNNCGAQHPDSPRATETELHLARQCDPPVFDSGMNRPDGSVIWVDSSGTEMSEEGPANE